MKCQTAHPRPAIAVNARVKGADSMSGLVIEREVLIEAPVDPPTRLSFRWNYPRGEEPVTGNSMLVEFALTPMGDEQTRLRVTESGHELRVWPDAEKQRYADEHSGGWPKFLDRLVGVLTKPSR